MRLIAVLGFFALLFAPINGARGDEAANKKDLEAMKGTWSIVSAERNGETVTDTTVTLAFDGVSKVTVKRGEQLIFDGTVVVDASKSPKTIDITPESGEQKGKTIPGIYEVAGDSLKVCSGKERPTDLTAAAGSGRFLRVYKRAAK